MTNNTNLVKTYTDRAYKHTTMVRHQGKVIAFAMDETRRIYYTMLDTSSQDEEKGVFDAKYWSTTPLELIFPAEITQVGYALVANTPMPTVKKHTREEADPGELHDSEIDTFLSSTARLTADAPFQVLSDGQHLYIFRQSLETSHDDMVYKLTDGNASGDLTRTDVTFMTSDGNYIPLVNSTLLADRFVLAGSNLTNVREIRYQRSRHKTQPQGAKDSLGDVDMQKIPFYEPTHELDFIDSLEGGRFSALLLPTKIPEIKRWQFFTHNSATGRIDSINLERSSEGLFDTRGTCFYTSPDPQYQSSVFENEPGQCPFTGADLVPVATSTGHGETCLSFDGSGDDVSVESDSALELTDGTLEAWIKPEWNPADLGSDYGAIMAVYQRYSFVVKKDYDGFVVGNGSQPYHFAASLTRSQWRHVALTMEGGTARVYLDGALVGSDTFSFGSSTGKRFRIGSVGGSWHFFKGSIDEVRLWNVARPAEVIDAYKGQRLVGNEPGLVGYWRLDEGSGAIAHDQTNGAHHGELKGNPTWVASMAPIGDSPGMRRTSFSVDGRDVAAGMSSHLYFQQENIASGYNEDAKPLKKQGRVMLAVPTTATAGDDTKPYLAAVDLGVSQEGRLAQAPDVLALPEIDQDMSTTLERIADNEQELAQLLSQTTEIRALGEGGQTVADSDLASTVSVSGNRAVVGIPDDPEYATGKAYFFDLDPTTETWTRQTWSDNPTGEIRGGDGMKNGYFGEAVSISGDLAVIGDPGYNATGSDGSSLSDIGAAYVFEREGSGRWNRTQKLMASNGTKGNSFGKSVSLSGDRVVIGASQYSVGDDKVGAAYVFERDGSGQWNETQQLMASDGAANDYFGEFLSLSGDRIVIGAPRHDIGNLHDVGVVYVFERDGSGQWNETQQLAVDAIGATSSFGKSLSISGDRIVLGNRTDHTAGPNAGAAYVFERNSRGQWNETQRLTASDSAALNYFGCAVSLSGNRIVIGSHRNDVGGESNAGAAYVFERDSAGQWCETRKLVASDGAADDEFGLVVSSSGDNIMIGADSAGAVWFFRGGLLPEALARKAQLEEEIEALRAELEEGVAEGMPVLATDVSGLTVSGSLLKFAYSDTRPQLFSRADGLLGLYFRGSDDGQFYGACFNPTSVQALFELTAGSEKLFLQARSAGADMSDTTIEVADGATSDTCNLTLFNANRGITETWQEVPRRAERLAEAIDGRAGQPVYVGKLASAANGAVTALTLTAEGLNQALPANANLRVGDARLTTGAALAAGASEVTVTSVDLAAPAETPVYWILYDYANATAEPAHYGLHNGSVLVRAFAPVTAANEPVANGEAALDKAGAGGIWAAEAPGRSYGFDGQDNHLALPDDRKAQADIEGDATLEAWVKPASVNGVGRILHHHTGDSRYALGIREASVRSALRFDGGNDYVQVEPNSDFNLTEGTLEAWIRPEWNPSNFSFDSGAIMGVPSRYVLLVEKDYDRIRLWDGSRSHYFAASLTQSQWHHVALTMEGGTARVYVDGALVGSDTFSFGSVTGNPFRIGNANGTSNFFEGSIDEVRLWNVAHSAEEINQYKDVALTGSLPGLVGCWRFTGGEASDYSDNGRHGTLHGFSDVNGALTESPIPTCQPFAAFGDRFVGIEDSVWESGWQHLAAVFNQAYALRFNGGYDYLEVEHSDSLSVTENLTIEAIIRPDRIDRRQLILGKGDPAWGNRVPYWLELTPGGGIRFIQESEDEGQRSLSVSGRLAAGNVYGVAVVRRKITDLPSEENDYTMPSRLTIEIYVDGNQVARTTIEPAVLPDANSLPAHIAGTENGRHFQGTISEILIWNSARAPERLHKEPDTTEAGLLGWWKLEENEGNVAFDANSGNHALIFGASWIKDPRPEGSSVELYVNGDSQKIEDLPADDDLVSAGWGDEQFTLGARRDGGGVTDAFDGEIEEVRIWQSVRTPEQLLDNLFTRLKEDKTDLVGYYTFDTVTDTEVLDGGLLANHLSLGGGDATPTEVVSTAPISTDTAEVRPALAGVSTSFHRRIDSAPAIAEYGDMQYDADGNFAGSMKRCYGYIDDGDWRLVTGYKVGELVREWVGQMQFDPQVIGFIEGAPPVPSENMTFGTNGTGTGIYEGDGAGVTFTRADEVNYSYSNGRENGYQSSMELSATLGGGVDLETLVAPLGFGVSIGMDIEAYVQGDVSFESEGAYATEQGFSSGRNRARSLEVTLGGNWEDRDTANQLNSYLGRRWAPANMGIALVQSETADMFALRLAHNQALVSYSLQQNPDIPKDWNLLPFPLNPRYVKQGTLDGKVGFTETGAVVEDPDYENIAREYGEHSYYKPTEAYALKRRIEQEQQRLATYYQNFDASPVGGVFGNVIKDSGQLMGMTAGAVAIGAVSPVMGGLAAAGMSTAATVGGAVDALKDNKKLVDTYSKRNLANTYVWTADGGFYADTTETTDVTQESVSGNVSFTTGISGGAGISMDIGATLEFEMNAGINTGVTSTSSKSREASKSFSLDVSVSPSGDMQYHDPESGEGEYDSDGNPANVHGRVDAYRFMTFYLDGASDNFDALFNKVVDPIWLEQSASPTAMAMRQARDDENKPPCWRVLHRVTFVSRILPPFSDELPVIEQAMGAENIGSNWQLIQTLEPFVQPYIGDETLFYNAVDKALQDRLPELYPHRVEIKQYMALYYGVGV
uniref:FG-GAP repeat-containing protein n=1 Tax=Candidatus Kentrum sp. SD TaxID=2126332 RepID=A0A450YC49_9GAMM|nr:MAG: FG-GAP repeat-containing protein [Candidatus Kentron sp. SD]VFK39126.1 MAG: FG-GAP repeat-containing protein [Candidatus Kentron sp. SD]VFK77798.1 MAG: FG-GAP repeat-containing protein [Candidatus Kentron sp. SD]